MPRAVVAAAVPVTVVESAVTRVTDIFLHTPSQQRQSLGLLHQLPPPPPPPRLSYATIFAKWNCVAIAIFRYKFSTKFFCSGLLSLSRGVILSQGPTVSWGAIRSFSGCCCRVLCNISMGRYANTDTVHKLNPKISNRNP